MNLLIVIKYNNPGYMLASFPTLCGYEYLFIIYGLAGIGIPLLIDRGIVIGKVYVRKAITRERI